MQNESYRRHIFISLNSYKSTLCRRSALEQIFKRIQQQRKELYQWRRLCGDSGARAPSEIILWGPSPHRNFSYLSNNIHIYTYTHTYISIYNGNCRSGPSRNFSKSAPLCAYTHSKAIFII